MTLLGEGSMFFTSQLPLLGIGVFVVPVGSEETRSGEAGAGFPPSLVSIGLEEKEHPSAL